MKPDNFVAKNAHLTNKSVVFDDKKKKAKKGYKKHKKGLKNQEEV